jgi:hypothetical protein
MYIKKREGLVNCSSAVKNIQTCVIDMKTEKYMIHSLKIPVYAKFFFIVLGIAGIPRNEYQA